MLSGIFLFQAYFPLLIDLIQPPIEYRLSFGRSYEAREILLMIIYSFIMISGTIGNVIVIKSFLRKTNQPGSRFVVCLAVVDLISSILVPFNNIVSNVYLGMHWPFGKLACLLIHPWLGSTFYASAWLLVVISLERTR